MQAEDSHGRYKKNMHKMKQKIDSQGSSSTSMPSAPACRASTASLSTSRSGLSRRARAKTMSANATLSKTGWKM